ncbi:3D domain-containing protein [Kamptonema cortianum]|nr:3D domain-containing protein [Oscillatoria laete-virens]MDK3160306.1 3D domain-containing protein [Kamptonema cortianum]MDL5053686.1 3D domain-containing protein [Oscillatoria laete-virens NRMC-F 0139]
MKNTTLFMIAAVLSLGLMPLAQAKKTIKTKITEVRGEEWVITAYSDSAACNGKWGPVTADGGDRLKWGMIAADWSVLPPGTKVKIEGFGDQIFVVRDKGRLIKGQIIDLYIPNASRKQLYSWGRKKLKIEVLPEDSYSAKAVNTEDRSLFERYSFIPRKTDVVQARTPYVVNRSEVAKQEAAAKDNQIGSRMAGNGSSLVQRRLQMRN